MSAAEDTYFVFDGFYSAEPTGFRKFDAGFTVALPLLANSGSGRFCLNATPKQGAESWQ